MYKKSAWENTGKSVLQLYSLCTATTIKKWNDGRIQPLLKIFSDPKLILNLYGPIPYLPGYPEFQSICLFGIHRVPIP